MSIPSPLMQPSPNGRRVGIRIVTFEACSGFTRITARRIAQPPKATFVTRLQPGRLPDQAARQLPDLSTSIRVDPSSTGDPRLRGARPFRDTRLTWLAMLIRSASTSSGHVLRGMLCCSFDTRHLTNSRCNRREVLCGWFLHCKNFFEVWHLDQEQSCVRPVCAV